MIFIKTKKITIIIYLLLILCLAQTDSNSDRIDKLIQSDTERGTYIPGNLVTQYNMRLLPVPKGVKDYAFYQSIQRTNNVVIGKFKQGEKEIILLQDNNNDGKVEIAARWLCDADITALESEPDKFCSVEDFIKLKNAIVNGTSESFNLGGRTIVISPNKKAFSELETLIKTAFNIVKSKEGLRIFKLDPDEPASEMEIFSYSVNSSDGTVNLAFETKYFFSGQNRIAPVIKTGVYCLKSEDPTAKEFVKKISKIASEYFLP